MKKALAALVICLAAAASAAAQTPVPVQGKPRPTPPPAPAEVKDPHAGHKMAEQPAQEQTAASKYFSDVELLDQDGRKVRFYSDMLKGKIVVVNAFFTTCTSVCPPMNRSMEKIQEALGDRLGKEVFLVSISVDPLTDTPPRIKE